MRSFRFSLALHGNLDPSAYASYSARAEELWGRGLARPLGKL